MATTQATKADRPKDHFVGHHYAAQHEAGPLRFLNPTKRTFTLAKPAAKPEVRPDVHAGQEPEAEPPVGAGPADTETSTGVYHVWRSRDNRKGRHAVEVTPGHVEPKAGEPLLKVTENLAGSWSGIWKMCVRYPVWDVSYDVAVIFTIGACL